jgi:hypothetical protein
MIRSRCSPAHAQCRLVVSTPLKPEAASRAAA